MVNRRVLQWIDTWDSTVQRHWVHSGPAMSEKAPEMMEKCKRDIESFQLNMRLDQIEWTADDLKTLTEIARQT
jgi:hypothetical protein